jgi:hypothetical protein
MHGKLQTRAAREEAESFLSLKNLITRLKFPFRRRTRRILLLCKEICHQFDPDSMYMVTQRAPVSFVSLSLPSWVFLKYYE